MTQGYPGVPNDAIITELGQFRRIWRQAALTINNLLVGKINSVGSVTLTANQTTTVVSDPLATINSFIEFMPTTANAASEKAAGGMYVSSQGNKTFTVTHANAATVDRTFRYVVLG